MPLAAAGVTGTGKLERRAEVELERDGDRTVDGTNAPLSAARRGQAPQPRSGAPEQGYRIWILLNWARRRVTKVSSHAARMRFAFMDPLEPSSLARLRARRRSRAMFCGP